MFFRIGIKNKQYGMHAIPSVMAKNVIFKRQENGEFGWGADLIAEFFKDKNVVNYINKNLGSNTELKGLVDKMHQEALSGNMEGFLRADYESQNKISDILDKTQCYLFVPSVAARDYSSSVPKDFRGLIDSRDGSISLDESVYGGPGRAAAHDSEYYCVGFGEMLRWAHGMDDKHKTKTQGQRKPHVMSFMRSKSGSNTNKSAYSLPKVKDRVNIFEAQGGSGTVVSGFYDRDVIDSSRKQNPVSKIAKMFDGKGENKTPSAKLEDPTRPSYKVKDVSVGAMAGMKDGERSGVLFDGKGDQSQFLEKLKRTGMRANTKDTSGQRLGELTFVKRQVDSFERKANEEYSVESKYKKAHRNVYGVGRGRQNKGGPYR